jgi:RNA polymerase sigma-70 factor (ECF subfamily)
MLKESVVPKSTTASSADDAFLLALVQSGDEKAMSAIYDRYSKIVYSIALRVLSDSNSAEDVLHETFMQVWRNPDSLTAARSSLGGWLALVARNRSIDALRRKRPLDSVEIIALTSPATLAAETDRDTFLESARSAIQRLPQELRKTLDMAFFDGLTHSEIAEMTGEHLEIVRGKIRSALMPLREEFQP